MGGWIAAFLRPSDPVGDVAVFPTFTGLLAAAQRPVVLAIDVPIGLPVRAGAGGRAAENLVRPLLGARQSSVFSVPSRAAVEASTYAAACAAALATSEPPRKVSKQLFNIAPKVREVDAALRARPELVSRIYEVHPELAFWRLNGEKPLAEPKKVKSRPFEPGLTIRRDLLKAAGLPPALVDGEPPNGAGPDDLLDALACAAIARRIHAGFARPFPDPPPRDAYGLPMAIWA